MKRTWGCRFGLIHGLDAACDDPAPWASGERAGLSWASAMAELHQP